MAAAALLAALYLVALDEMTPGDSATIHVSMAFALLIGLAATVAAARLSVRAGKEASGQVAVAELIRARDAAMTANAAKSRYLANISHEIRSPLNAIYGYAQLVERGDGKGAGDAAKVIRRSAEHLTSLVEGLLDISQIENGVLRVKQEAVQFDAFLDHVEWMLRPTATAKGLDFHAEYPAVLPEYVRMDQHRLRQVLINLLSNAIKFTDGDGVTFRVRYASEIAVFEISDTGPGIRPEDRERIFDPYERGGDGHRPGLGLGLPITKAIVAILGGQLDMDSVPGEGTTFRVTVMLGKVAGPAPETSIVRSITGYEGARRNVLLVEDDERQAAFMKGLLEGLGFATSVAPNGETAVSLAHSKAFELAILDISLPGMSGWETAMRLREIMAHSVSIIMLSANSQEFHKPETDTPMHDLFLVKPIDFDALINAIGGLLNLRWVSRKAGDTPMAPQQVTASGLSVPPAGQIHVERLRELLRIGHVRGIESEIRMLEQNCPEAGPLVAMLYECLDRFDLGAMTRKLEGISQ